MTTVILKFLLIFVMVWWVVFFMVLPFKAQPPKKPGRGHAASAPQKPFIGMKILITTLVALLISGMIAFVLVWNGIY